MNRNSLLLIVLLLVAMRSGNCQSCFSGIPSLNIPLVFDESSFDFYAAENPYIATENEIKECLMAEGDEFINRKNTMIEDLDNKTYPDYFVVGTFPFSNGISIYFYYRTIQPPNSFILFDLVMVTKKGNAVIDNLVISKLSHEDEYYSAVMYDEDGNVVIQLQSEQNVRASYKVQPSGHFVERVKQ